MTDSTAIAIAGISATAFVGVVGPAVAAFFEGRRQKGQHAHERALREVDVLRARLDDFAEKIDLVWHSANVALNRLTAGGPRGERLPEAVVTAMRTVDDARHAYARLVLVLPADDAASVAARNLIDSLDGVVRAVAMQVGEPTLTDGLDTDGIEAEVERAPEFSKQFLEMARLALETRARLEPAE